ncbi:MAG: hypothetical protein ABID64_05250 [Nitrospirota bacterium]
MAVFEGGSEEIVAFGWSFWAFDSFGGCWFVVNGLMVKFRKWTAAVVMGVGYVMLMT